MNRKSSFVAILAVIVALFAMTSMVSAAGEVTLYRAGDSEVPVDGITSISMSSTIASDNIQWYKATKSDGSDGVAVSDNDGNPYELTVA